jgi:cytochrome c5
VAQIAEQPVAKIAPTPEPASEPEPEPAASEPAAAAATADSSAVGEGVYQKACKSCHDLGVANAPKLGDAAAWAPRIAKGHDTLFKSVMNGLNAMPPKGACMSCSDAELRSAMEYMIVKGS